MTGNGIYDRNRFGNDMILQMGSRLIYACYQILREDYVASQLKWLEFQDRSAPPVLKYPCSDDMDRIGPEAEQRGQGESLSRSDIRADPLQRKG